MHFKHCILCVAGLLVAFAYDDISHNKTATQSHTKNNFDASKAVDRDTETCMRTDDIGVSGVYKTVWWKVDLGGVYSIYSINILFKNYDGYDNRQRGRFAGFSLYVSNNDVSSTEDIKSSTLCYKDGPQLPHLDFTSVCTGKGRYVIFYNDRLNEGYPDGYEVANVITELCEVMVEGCKNVSVYGSNCDKQCPTNCKDSTCHIESGACFNCQPGWTGGNCNVECRKGWYGDNCSQQCVGHCKGDTTCNHVSGRCDGGCDAGWGGDSCKKGETYDVV